MRWLSLAGIVVGTLAGCLRLDGFACENDAQCVEGNEIGRCEPTGWCSFDDEDCETGSRYGEHAGDGLSGTCVPGDDGSSETDEGESGESSSTEPETGSTAGECADLNGSCQLDDDCCTPCMRCDEGTCVARTGESEPCGDECQACSGLGECEIAVGAWCGAQTLDCGDYVWGESDASCYGLAPNQISGQCDSLGQCAAPDPGNCPPDQGEVLVSCDVACFDPNHGCTPGKPVVEIDPSSICILNQKTPGCDRSCSDGTGSTEYDLACDLAGQCSWLSTKDCGGYRCDGDACGTSCFDESDCIWFHVCTNNECVPG